MDFAKFRTKNTLEIKMKNILYFLYGQMRYRCIYHW